MTAVVITQPMLFPWPGFFEQLMLADAYLYLDDAQFSKGSFTNRIQVKYGDDRRWMTIPLAGKGSFQPIAELKATDGDWKSAHRALLAQSLADAPHRDDALGLLDAAYAHDDLCDLLIASIEEPARYLGIGSGRDIGRTTACKVEGTSWQRVLDLVLDQGGTRYLTGHGAARYLDHDAFEAAGVGVEYMAYSLTPWPQGKGAFTPYVSILDLIAHTGRDAITYLRPATVAWRPFLKQRRENP
ncbi:WbqC-like protein [Azorhizobium sp. AG788]|uniref:WbqC family protein n=1 Tax=Azorhizobium sp. AG788 TaxID=2183897 RepID=UPI001060FE57|nr:WbqC family protein [Azorhizobium sp. AG788]TDU01199.1 WbqC-like protein [Azorhizobium sp. AG788]